MNRSKLSWLTVDGVIEVVANAHTVKRNNIARFMNSCPLFPSCNILDNSSTVFQPEYTMIQLSKHF